MQKIVTDRHYGYSEITGMLEGFEHPAILVSTDYEILGFNRLYEASFGALDLSSTVHHCYKVSHGYNLPCDQSGEDCPLHRSKINQRKERVLHIHQTRNGREHIEIETIPIYNQSEEPIYFVEIMKPIPFASGTDRDQTMAGNSPEFVRLLDRIAKVGKSDAAVLLLGESGTGKELAAKALHQSSPRKNAALITLECSGLTDTLFESELFGYSKGAFTGASTSKKGLVELAHGGTLFLDEIADVPIKMQVKLLRLLENRTFRPLGSTEVKTSDFRLICATHKNIQHLVDDEKFRLDLYHRINVFPIRLPSLKERVDDIPLIAQTLLKQLEPDKEFFITESALEEITRQPLKGNIRELRNILNRAVVLIETNIIDKSVIEECLEYGTPLPHNTSVRASAATDLPQQEWVDLKTLELNYLLKIDKAFEGDIPKISDTLGISPRSLYRKLKEAKLASKPHLLPI